MCSFYARKIFKMISRRNRTEGKSITVIKVKVHNILFVPWRAVLLREGFRNRTLDILPSLFLSKLEALATFPGFLLDHTLALT